MELSHEEAMQVLRKLALFLGASSSAEVERILGNLRDYSYACKSGNGKWNEEETEYQSKRLKEKLLSELGFIKKFPDIERIK